MPPLIQEEVVAIHPHKAATLASALRSSGSSLRLSAQRARAALGEAMEDAGPIGHVLEAAEWMEAHARALQGVVDEIWLVEATGSPARFGAAAIWRAPYDEAHDHPSEAFRAADDARRHFDPRQPDVELVALDAFALLVERWATNPVFAAQLVADSVSDDVADLLRRAEELQAAAPDDQRGASMRRAIDSFFTLAATASRFGALPWTFADVVDLIAVDLPAEAGDEAGAVPRRARPLVSLLFAPGSRWSDEVLIEAVVRVVLPANRQAKSSDLPQQSVHGVDGRARVLAALARNPRAAQRALTEAPLDDLLANANRYDDGGRALGDVLVAGTAPGPPESTAAARLVIDWVAAHRDLPPFALDRLGAVVVPYLSAFRAPAFDDDHSLANPLPGMGDGARADVLAYAATRERSLVELRTGELVWARDRVLELGAAPGDGAGLRVLANIDSRVADSCAAGVLAMLQVKDEQDAASRAAWIFLANVLAGFLPGSELIGTVAAFGAEKAIVGLSPPTEFVKQYAGSAREQRRLDEALFEHLVISALWQQRHHNHAFDTVPLPPGLLTGEPPQVKALVLLTAEEQYAYTAWKHDPRVKAATHWPELAVWGQ